VVVEKAGGGSKFWCDVVIGELVTSRVYIMSFTWTMFSGFMIVVWFLSERSSPSFGRSLDLHVMVLGFPPTIFGW
jgi:hypothetical protein